MFARFSLKSLLFLTICLVIAPAAFAQNRDDVGFPSRPVRIVVSATPGGQPDIYARLITPSLSEVLHQQIVVDNRAGAGGVIGTQIVAEANPDGHTLLSVSASHVILPAFHARLPYDVHKDFAGITMTATTCYLLMVPPSLGVNSVQELIALAKAKPGQLNFSSSGTGTGMHLAGEMLKQSAHIDVVHVPYKGPPEAMTDAVAGRVQFILSSIASSVNLVRSGRLRALGVTCLKRASIVPDVPTIAEAGLPGFEWVAWSGLFAPAKTPRPVVNKLNREITRILRLPDMEQRFHAVGAAPAPMTSTQFDKFVAEQLALAAQLAKKAGIESK